MTRGFILLCALTFGCQRAPRDKPKPPLTTAVVVEKGAKRVHESVVYVDGKPRASLTAAELPPGAAGPRLALCDYLREIGVACSSVHQLHLYVAGSVQRSVGPTELARLSLEIADGKRPRIADVDVSDVAVYVDKTPPPPPITGIPFLDEPVRGGTRVNVDGRLAARMKRNQLDGSLPELGEVDGEPRYSLGDFLTRLHLGAPRAVELVTADDQIIRVPDEETARVSFSAEEHQHGQMSFRFANRRVSAVAVNVYVQAAPPVRAPLDTPLRVHQAGFSAGCDMAAEAPIESLWLFLLVAGAVLVVFAQRRWS